MANQITEKQLKAVPQAHGALAQDFWLGKLNPMQRIEIMNHVKDITNSEKLSTLRSIRFCHAYLYLTQTDEIWIDYAESGMQELDLEIGYVVTR